MNVTRIAILGVALVAGGGAFFLMMGNNKSPAPALQPAAERTIRVLVAGRDFQRGERLGADGTKWIAWPEKAMSAAFVTEATAGDPEQLAQAVARSLIVAGEPIIEQKIARVGATGLMAAILAPGMRAVTQRVSPETASGGFILPGDRVDVLHTLSSGQGSARTRTLFEDVRVLAVNAVYGENQDSAYLEGVNVTLEFAPDDAERFVTARSSGTVSLALRSVFPADEDAKPKRSSDVTVIRYGRS
jgi:pilus assembly protein CpaB